MEMIDEYFRITRDYSIEKELEKLIDSFEEVDVFYDYVDGEEGDTYKREYYYGNHLVAVKENFGGDRYDIEFTNYGKLLLLEKHFEMLKENL